MHDMEKAFSPVFVLPYIGLLITIVAVTAPRAALRSELLISTHGLLRLNLEPALYEWEFVGVNGNVLDRGLNICH